jgi:hypothetical protein
MEAQSVWTFTSWDETPYAELDGAAKMTRASIRWTLDGDLRGDASTEMLMFYADDGTAHYVSLDRVSGSLGDRSGTFVLRGVGSYDGSEARATLTVLPGSGTGELKGLRGEGAAGAGHGNTSALKLSYQLG